ncbi:hypothetical protein B2J88_27005 [Rhodococcus sp. SRB_17]|nr:hypothetical protein [Rhodococcus sp. SRB_17]
MSVSEPDRFWSLKFSDVPAERYPALAALADCLDSASATTEFERALERLLTALQIEVQSDAR